MNTIKIYNGSKIFLKANIDFEYKKISNVENNDDLLLNSIFFNDFSFSRVLSFIKSRLKNFDNSDSKSIIAQINETHCKLFDDNISIQII